MSVILLAGGNIYDGRGHLYHSHVASPVELNSFHTAKALCSFVQSCQIRTRSACFCSLFHELIKVAQ